MNPNENEELYVKSQHCKPDEQTYICSGTGNVCRLATKHFTEFYNRVKNLSDTNSDRVFLTVEENLCTKYKCHVYNIVMQKITEFAKNNAK